jgi:sulfonate dioxygenase
VGYKKEESDNLLNFLYDHIAFGADFQARVQWKPRMVIFWDVSALLTNSSSL